MKFYLALVLFTASACAVEVENNIDLQGIADASS